MSEKLTVPHRRGEVKCDNCLLTKCDNCDCLGVGEDHLT